MLQLPGSLSPIATPCTHCYTHAQNWTIQLFFEHRQGFLSFFFSFSFFLYAEPLLSVAVIHSPQTYRFLRGRLHIFSFPLSAGQPSSPVNPPSLLTRLWYRTVSLSFFVHACCCCPSFTPFPHVFLMCSCTHIVLIPLSPTRCGVGTGTRLTNGRKVFFFSLLFFSFGLHLLPYIIFGWGCRRRGVTQKNSCLRQFYAYKGNKCIKSKKRGKLRENQILFPINAEQKRNERKITCTVVCRTLLHPNTVCG
jgi:hypothetical protein